ncbi:MAG TPA: hypothetical protein VFV17_01310 [Usitatibacteraceae bacterium]|nr:hypothetical protein [Usitatibacteraceae bacterium]
MTPRGKLLALAAIFILPTIASFAAFYLVPPSGHSSYGTLIRPVIALPGASLPSAQDSAGAAERQLRGKWLLLTRDSGRCEARCLNKLHIMRQARLILGREQDRVVRVVLVDDDVQPSAGIQQQFSGTVWIAARDHPWLAALGKAGLAAGDEIIGVDPLGNAFIRFPGDADIKRLAQDIRRVLKASQIG